MLWNRRSLFRYQPITPAVREWGIYVVNAGHAVVPPGSPFPTCQHPRDHHGVARGRGLPTYHFLYVAAGQGDFESGVTGIRPLAAGDLVILQPGVWHRYLPVFDVGWHEYRLEFDGDLARRWMSREEFREAGPILPIGTCLPFFGRVIDLLRQERPGVDLILGALAAEAIAEVLAVLKQGQGRGRPLTMVIREAKSLLAHGHANPSCMAEFARRLNMSYSAFRRTFKAETGIHRAVSSWKRSCSGQTGCSRIRTSRLVGSGQISGLTRFTTSRADSSGGVDNRRRRSGRRRGLRGFELRHRLHRTNRGLWLTR